MTRIAVALFATAPVLFAQAPALILPVASPRATVSQNVGLTKVEVTYNRPAIKGRKVWGGLVPYGKVWRARADENTVVAFSTPVRVDDPAVSGDLIARGKQHYIADNHLIGGDGDARARRSN